jgi:hypothetical protein
MIVDHPVVESAYTFPTPALLHMKSVRAVATAALALAVLAHAKQAHAQTQTVTFSVSASSTMSVSGNPAAMNITSIPLGQPSASVTNSATTYSVTTNEADKKITAALSAVMPTGVTLSINLVAPSTGVSSGTVVLGTTAANVVTSIDAVNQSGLTITYTLTALATAGEVASQSRVVTFTVTDGP